LARTPVASAAATKKAIVSAAAMLIPANRRLLTIERMKTGSVSNCS
jgi:hypothetical protein